MTVLENRTPFPGELMPAQDAEGRLYVVAVVKATYAIGPGGAVAPAARQHAIWTADEYAGEPGASSLAHASDMALFKRATDVVMFGSARAPHGRAVRRMEVELCVGALSKRISVFGDRRWVSRLRSRVATEPAPFEAMPLVYERAYGGRDGSEFEPRNPVGVGFWLNRPEEGAPLPNIEDPRAPISHWTDRPTPQGFGPVCRHWQPRATYGGRYDDVWRCEQFPLPPRDMDSRYFQIANPDLVCAPYLQGDETVRIAGMAPSGVLAFSLPGVIVALGVHYRRGRPERRGALLDTLELRPDERCMTLTWRSTIRCPRKIADVESVVAFPLRLTTARELMGAPAAA